MSEPVAPPSPAPKKPPRFGRARDAQGTPAAPAAVPPIPAPGQVAKPGPAAPLAPAGRAAPRFIPPVLLNWNDIPEPTGQLAELGRLAAASLSGPVTTAATTLPEFRARYKGEAGFLEMCKILEIKPKVVEGADGSEVGSGDGTIPLRLTAIQATYCRIRTARDIILKPRQVKITTVELARDLWFFLTKKGVGVRIVCQSSSEHTMLNELADRIDVYMNAIRKNAGLHLDDKKLYKNKSKGEWHLAAEHGGSTLIIIEAGASEKAAQKKGRGGTIHRLHTTELSVCEYAGATLNAILPSMAGARAGTEIVHESTPNGAGGEDRGSYKTAAGGELFYWYYQDAKAKKSTFQAVFFNWLAEPEYSTPLEIDPETGELEELTPVTDREIAVVNAGATPEQLKWYRAGVIAQGQDDIDQEFPLDDITCFLVSGRKFFDKSITQALLDGSTDGVETEIRRNGASGTLRIWREWDPKEKYVIGVDTSEGTGGNAGGGQVYERGSGIHVATLHGQFKPDQLAIELDKLGRAYGLAEIAVERNNHGAAVLQELDRVGFNPDKSPKVAYPNIWKDHDGKIGWNNVPTKRTTSLDNLEAAHRTGQWRSYDRAVLGEFRSFIINKGRPEAMRGAQDDLVMMAAIAWDVLRQVPVTIHAQSRPRDASNLPRLADSGPRYDDDDRRDRDRGRGRDDGGRGYG